MIIRTIRNTDRQEIDSEPDSLVRQLTGRQWKSIRTSNVDYSTAN